MPRENEEKERERHLCCHQAHSARWKRDYGRPQHGTGTLWFVGMRETRAGYTGGESKTTKTNTRRTVEK